VGRLGDIYGKVKFYSLGYFVFAAGVLLCALSTDIYQLLGFRLIQGIGGTLLFVYSMALVTGAFAGRGLGLGIGINQIAINAGTIIGYTLSGVIISMYGWRALFLIHVPIGLFGGLWAKFRLMEVKFYHTAEKFDLLGAIAFSSSLVLLMLGLTAGSFASPITLSLLFASSIMFLIFFIHEKRATHPMLDFSLFRIRAFTTGNLSNLLNGLSFASLAFLISVYLEVVVGLSPLHTGLSLIPIDLTLILIGPVSGWISDRVGTKMLTTAGLVITAAALIMLTNISENLDYHIFLIGLILAGLGVGIFRSPNASSVMGSVPSDKRGVAAGVRSTIINTSTALSIPLSIAIISSTIPLNELSEIINGESHNMASTMSIGLIQGIRNSLLASAFLNIIAAVISYFRE